MAKQIGLTIMDEGWALAESSGRKEVKLTQVRSGEWSPDEPVAAKAAVIQQAFLDYGLSKEKVMVSAPLKAGFWRVLVLPALAPRETERLIKHNFFASIPELPAEPCWGYKKYKGGANQLRAACFALSEQVKDELHVLLEKAGISPAYYLPDLEGLRKGMKLAAPEDYNPQGAVLYVIANRLTVEVAQFEGENLTSYRCFPLLLTEELIHRQALVEDLRLTKHMIRKESNLPPHTCYLWDQTGQYSDEEWKVLLAAGFDLEPHRINTAVALKLGLEVGVENAGTAFRRLIAVGLAAEGGTKDPAGLHLTSGANRQQKGEKLRAVRLLVFALIIALVGVGLNGWLNYQAKQRLLSDLVEKEPKVQEIRNLMAQDENLRKRANFYRGNWERTRQMLVFFNLWAETAPEGTILTSVMLEEERITQLSGRTRSFSQLYAALLASPSFHQLQLKGEITINRDGYEGFTLAGKWNEPNSFSQGQSGVASGVAQSDLAAADLAMLQHQARRVNTLLSKEQFYQQRLAESQKALTGWERSLWRGTPEQATVELVALVEKMAAHRGLVITNKALHPALKGPALMGWQRIGVTVEGRAAYRELTGFYDDLITQAKTLFIERLELRLDEYTGLLHYRISLYSFTR